MAKHSYTYSNIFNLENGGSLPQLEVTYHTYGELNSEKSNVVWFCHALTANSDVMDWWDSLVRIGKTYDPSRYFIVCANILGSCYGSSGPLSINPRTGSPYFSTFPQVTIRDMVKGHILLRKHLSIENIHTIVGGSMGGYQALEWIITEPAVFKKLVLVATSPQESAWGIAVHTAQRLAIEADPTWKDPHEKAGAKGLKAARAIGMLTYRTYDAFVKTQTDSEHKIDNFKASSYINYQGDKLVNRFNAYSYRILGKAMDSHNIARGRGKMEDVLKSIKTKTIIIGISSDQLCPVTEQQYMSRYIPDSTYIEIDSPYGHDGFLIEGKLIGEAITSNS
ncbi:MAG: metX [Bacteroidetes bacterium]|jgi:homoserine O-acetyltransferase|nr:metX [Bacteroidota bacterium]